jgi:prepilin-type N-terminal cleavage/methylation domain-containing protein
VYCVHFAYTLIMNKGFRRNSWIQSNDRLLTDFSESTNVSGFTIVELLVVIVIIAILAAVTIVSYTGISQRARVVSLQADLSNSSTQLKIFQTVNGIYPGSISDCPTPAPTNLCLKYSAGNSYVYYSINNQSNPPTFLLMNSNGNLAYEITQDTAPIQVASTMQTGVTPGAILEFRGIKGNGGTSPGINSPLTTTWYDTSGNGNNGTLYNFAGTTTNGWAGSGTTTDPYALVFDGSSDYVATPSLAASSGNFTYEAWIKFTSTSAGLNIISEGGSSSSNPFVQLNTGVSGSDGEIRVQMRNNSGAAANVASTANYNDGNWHHVVGCYDGTKMHLYVDGTEVGTPVAAPAGPYTENQTRIGTRGYTTPAFNFAGSISVARIYPFALSAAQVLANYTAGPNT